MVAAMKRREFITLLAGWRGRSTPNVPVYQNTFFPPNQSTAKRSYRFGQVIKEAIESWPLEKRVAVFASGGMSHFVIDEEFDRKSVSALKSRDKDYLSSIPLKDLQSGTSELKSWISLAGLLEGRQCRGARDRLCTLLSFARRYRHGEWILLVGHERPIVAVRARPHAQAPSRDRQRRGRAIRSPRPRCSRHCQPWRAPARLRG